MINLVFIKIYSGNAYIFCFVYKVFKKNKTNKKEIKR